MKAAISILSFLFIATSVFAQDKIYKKDKTVIDCKVTEIGINEVKYLLPEEEMANSPIMSISVSDILKVVLSSGREIEFKDPLTDPNTYAEDKKHALKFHFLSPLSEHLAFAYEKSIRPGRSFESELGIIGAGFDSDESVKSSGVYISSGYKFLKTPDFYSHRMKYAHVLKGGYVKPQLILSIYHNETKNAGFTNNDIERDIVAGAILVNLGKQIIYDNFFLIDYSVGIGYGFSNQSKVDNNDFYTYRHYHYGFLLTGEDIPLAFAIRIKVGILL